MASELPSWTPAAVMDRLLEAAATQIGIGVRSANLPPIPEIQRAEQTITWLAWLEATDAELVWARAKRTRWKAICWKLGLSRPTAHRRWQRSLRLIVAQLNGR